MSRWTQCGQRPPARGYQRVCPVCDALCQVDQEADDVEEQINAIFDKCDRIQKLRIAYARRR